MENYYNTKKDSIIKELFYFEETKKLYIQFKTGKYYNYLNVPKSAYEDIIKADSLGSYFHKNIKNKYEFEKV